jgi:hypothetical protein
MNISRRTHGYLDYIVGVLLILAPRLFGFNNGGPEDRVPEMLGVATLVYSLLTNYELGLLKVLPFKAHLTLDVLSGNFLALSPWLFGFADRVWAPHVIVGVVELAAVAMTRRSASEHPTGFPGTPAHL